MSDEESGPRTRTRRGSTKATPVKSPKRATRSTRSRKAQETAEVIEENEMVETIDVDAADDHTHEDTLQVLQELQELAGQQEDEEMPPPANENSATFPFEDFPAEVTPNESSVEKEESVKEGSESREFVASLAAEENANSLPSASDLLEFSAEIGPVIAAEDKVDDATGSSDHGISEDIQNGDSDATKADPDAEMVSEDELPAPEKVVVKDAVEVSDDELPPPKAAELPADAENVSDEELPAVKPLEAENEKQKRKTEDEKTTENAEKKFKKDEEAEEGKKKLPELEKYWKAVRDDSSDFTAWTYLLQYVDHENDVEAAREAYDAFLSHYPYCYGYWRKYADYEKRKGNKKKCEEVFERGLKAIPLSVDLWIHYLAYCKENRVKDEEFIRSQFERALSACGLEFRSDKLWEAYIRWETENKDLRRVVVIYDRLLATPTQGYNSHFDNFQDLANTNQPLALIPVEEFKKLRDEVRSKDSKKEADNDDVPPGEDEPDDHVRSDEEATAIRNRLVSNRKKIHKANVVQVSNRWTYEEGIKRPYFHVKPLERIQLKNWKDYLDYEISQGKQDRIIVLFERCLIACALYDEFWLKLIRYLETQSDENAIARTRDAYERACTIHHTNKPNLHLMWAGFEELQGNAEKAVQILANLDKAVPNVLQVAYKRINIERRRGNLDKCVELYEHYIGTAKNKTLAANLSIKYARFLNKIQKDISSAIKLLQSTIEKDPSNTRLALQLIDLLLQKQEVDEKEVVEVMSIFMNRDNIEPDQKVLFAQRKVEFLEDFGSDCKTLQIAQKELHHAIVKANEAKKKAEEATAIPSTTNNSKSYGSKSKEVNPPLPSSNSYGNSSAYNYGASAASGQGAYYGGYDGYYAGANQWGQYGNYGYGYGYGGGSYGGY